MNSMILSFPGSESLSQTLSNKLGIPLCEYVMRQFPDKETYVQIKTPVSGQSILLVCSLHQPNEKVMQLYLLAQTLKDLGAQQVILLTPYLPYMRQDIRFKDGEGITSKYFAQLICAVFDGLITVDPHLHRYQCLSEIYTIDSIVVHAAKTMAYWIKRNINKPLLVGPDSESQQWVDKVAGYVEAPYIVLEKTRHGDEFVEVSVPDVAQYQSYTPVLVDDIISTAHTMMETIGHLHDAGMSRPVCMGVHALFAGDAYAQLQAAGAGRIVTCNSIEHDSNAIDLSDVLVDACKKLQAG